MQQVKFPRLLAVLVVGLLSPLSALAQSHLELDAVSFRYDSTHSQIEVYYGLVKRLLLFTSKGGSNWEAPINAKVEIWQEGNKVAEQEVKKSATFTGTKEQLEADAANKIIDLVTFNVPSNKPTTVYLIWQSKIDGKTISDTIVRPNANTFDNASDRPTLSGIELASSLEKASGNGSPFEKVGYTIIPNPSAIFGEQYSKLYYYSELYLPKEYVDPQQSIDVVSRILDGANREMLTNTQKISLAYANLPVLGYMDIDGLPGDAYTLEIKVMKNGQEIARNIRKFYCESSMIVSEETPQAATDEDAIYLTSPISKLSENDITEQFAQSMYIGNSDDKKSFGAIKDLEGKRKFFFHFWRQRDAEIPNARPLQAYMSYFGRVAEANKKYTYQKTPGWKTGRGRVFIKYGKPDRTDDHLFEANSKPYIIWEYDDRRFQLTSGSSPKFVFVDRQGGGKFELVHSNVVKEMYQPDWYSREASRGN